MKLDDEIDMEAEYDLAVGSLVMLKNDEDGSDVGQYEVIKNVKLEGRLDGHYLLTLKKKA